MNNSIYIFLITLVFISCKKDDEVPQPIDDLPPATQVGAVMLACTVNGVPYICKGYEQVTAYYQWVNGGYGFVVTGRKETDSLMKISMGNMENAPIEEGKTYILNGDIPGYFGGAGLLNGFNNFESVVTNNNYTGEMTITKFDLENEIVSGTFWFDIENPWTGEKIEVREGRFDTHFSQ